MRRPAHAEGPMAKQTEEDLGRSGQWRRHSRWSPPPDPVASRRLLPTKTLAQPTPRLANDQDCAAVADSHRCVLVWTGGRQSAREPISKGRPIPFKRYGEGGTLHLPGGSAADVLRRAWGGWAPISVGTKTCEHALCVSDAATDSCGSFG